MSRNKPTLTNVPRQVFFFGLVLVLLSFVAGAARLPELAIVLIVLGILVGLTAFGLRAGDDG